MGVAFVKLVLRITAHVLIVLQARSCFSIVILQYLRQYILAIDLISCIPTVLTILRSNIPTAYMHLIPLFSAVFFAITYVCMYPAIHACH